MIKLSDMLKSFEIEKGDFTYGLTNSHELLFFSSPFKGMLEWYYNLFNSEKEKNNDYIDIDLVKNLEFKNNENTLIIFNEKQTNPQKFPYSLQLFNFRKEDDDNMFLINFTTEDLNNILWSFSSEDVNNEVTFFINHEHYGVSLKRTILQEEDFPLSKIPHMMADCDFNTYLNFLYNNKQVFVYPVRKIKDVFYQILEEQNQESLFIACPLLQ